MNTYEERVREFAHQIWESEGRPIGQECRHWDMACKLAEGLHNEDIDQAGSGNVLSVISPGEPFNPNPAPEIDPAPAEQPDVPVDPTPTHQPIQPTDPIPPNKPQATQQTPENNKKENDNQKESESKKKKTMKKENTDKAKTL